MSFMARMQRSQFAGADEKRYWSGLNYDDTVKLLAKMMREIAHLKPPRGRTGRWLPFERHFSMELVGGAGQNEPFSAKQLSSDLSTEVTIIEGRHHGNYNYDYREDFNSDLNRLQAMHAKHKAKLRIENTTNNLQDLVQGLMGLGLRDVEYEYERYGKRYTATMKMDNFVIQITDTGGEDE